MVLLRLEVGRGDGSIAGAHGFDLGLAIHK
jgi:hypothetical protein